MNDPTDRGESVDIERVKGFYNTEEIWDPKDKWHSYTKTAIQLFIDNFFKRVINGQRMNILNAGSAGNNYGLLNHEQLHVDIADKKLKDIPNSMVANIEKLPLSKKEFDLCLCVGSVINYCDAFKALGEFSRLVKKDGWLILEFENSRCFEYVFQPGFGQEAVIVETFYKGSKERLWAYSEGYIKRILRHYGFRIISMERFHILSSLVYRISKKPNFSALFSSIDPVLKRIPFLNLFCSNIILVCEKMV
ncbi:MAG: methyltransferase domain-containing protein [Bacteroidota bacterium]|jgi:ubiquinone/menaquinone biosynthesis C-methylase UbiE